MRLPYMADLTTIFHHRQRQLFPALAAELGALSALDQRFYEVISLTDLGRFTGPTSGVLQFQIGSDTFNDITNLSYPVTTSPDGSIGSIDLSTFTALQNVGVGTNVTFRIVNCGGTSSSGSWYISDVAGGIAPDLALQGTVTPIVAIGVPTLSVQLTNASVVFSWPSSFTRFVLQQKSNLNTTNWTTFGGTVSSHAGTMGVTIPSSAGNSFFRLIHP